MSFRSLALVVLFVIACAGGDQRPIEVPAQLVCGGHLSLFWTRHLVFWYQNGTCGIAEPDGKVYGSAIRIDGTCDVVVDLESISLNGDTLSDGVFHFEWNNERQGTQITYNCTGSSRDGQTVLALCNQDGPI